MYNKTFDVIVSADESGTVCVWNIATGAREGRFNKAHGDAKVSKSVHRHLCLPSWLECVEL